MIYWKRWVMPDGSFISTKMQTFRLWVLYTFLVLFILGNIFMQITCFVLCNTSVKLLWNDCYFEVQNWTRCEVQTDWSTGIHTGSVCITTRTWPSSIHTASVSITTWTWPSRIHMMSVSITTRTCIRWAAPTRSTSHLCLLHPEPDPPGSKWCLCPLQPKPASDVLIHQNPHSVWVSYRPNLHQIGWSIGIHTVSVCITTWTCTRWTDPPGSTWHLCPIQPEPDPPGSARCLCPLHPDTAADGLIHLASVSNSTRTCIK